jgi:hypothetical protein
LFAPQDVGENQLQSVPSDLCQLRRSLSTIRLDHNPLRPAIQDIVSDHTDAPPPQFARDVLTFLHSIQRRARSFFWFPSRLGVDAGRIEGACAVECGASGSLIAQPVTAGHIARLLIRTRDALGNDLHQGGADLAVEIRGPDSLVHRPAVRDLEDGSYECAAVLARVGEYQAAVLLRDEHVAGSPFAVRVAAAGAAAFQTSLVGCPEFAMAGITYDLGVEVSGVVDAVRPRCCAEGACACY